MQEQQPALASDQGHTLARSLGFAPLFFLVLANIVGTGIFTTSGFMMADLKSAPAMLLCWLVGGVLAMAGGLCYGELGAMFPQAGGDYVFLRESLGRRMAFLSGWISLWVGFSAPIAASAMAFASYFAHALPPWAQHPYLPKLLAAAAVLAVAAIHRHGVGFGARVQSGLTSLKLLVILVFLGAGFLWGAGSLASLSQPASAAVLSPAFATSLVFVSFAYSGWNATAYLGEEVKNPSLHIPASIISGTAVVIVLYLGLNLLYVYAVPPDQMKGVAEIGALAAGNLFGQAVGNVFTLFIAFFLLSSLSAMMMTGPRVYFAMARDGAFVRALAAIDGRRGTPARAIALQSIIALAMILTSTFQTLLIYIGFVLAIFSSLTVVGMMVLRVRQPGRPRPYRTWGYPVTPLLFIGLNLWIVVFSVRDNLKAFVAGAITLAAGLVVHEILRRRAARR